MTSPVCALNSSNDGGAAGVLGCDPNARHTASTMPGVVVSWQLIPMRACAPLPILRMLTALDAAFLRSADWRAPTAIVMLSKNAACRTAHPTALTPAAAIRVPRYGLVQKVR